MRFIWALHEAATDTHIDIDSNHQRPSEAIKLRQQLIPASLNGSQDIGHLSSQRYVIVSNAHIWCTLRKICQSLSADIHEYKFNGLEQQLIAAVDAVLCSTELDEAEATDAPLY